jgi:hypothetical protein
MCVNQAATILCLSEVDRGDRPNRNGADRQRAMLREGIFSMETYLLSQLASFRRDDLARTRGHRNLRSLFGKRG